MNVEEKAAAWDVLAKELDSLAPGWNSQEFGVRAPSEAARMAVRQMANAAEWGEYSMLRHHVRNELTVARSMLSHPGLPEDLKVSMQAHVMRLARMA